MKTIAGVPYLQGAVEVHSWNRQTMKQMMSAEPAQFELSQNYPNPFNPTTNIYYQLPMIKNHISSEISLYNVTLKIYDVLGQEVAMLVNEVQNPGYKSVEFNAEKLPSGIYFYRLQAGSYSDIKKMVHIK